MSRSSHEERGLKSLKTAVEIADKKSLLSRGAWIEMPVVSMHSDHFGSLLSRGAWIEISGVPKNINAGAGRSSHEERGLKWYKRCQQLPERPSLLSRGAWIEIHGRTKETVVRQRRSSHEERGLKSAMRGFPTMLRCRSSHEERGLKLLSGNYDKNNPRSLLSRGAWIEIVILYVIK